MSPLGNASALDCANYTVTLFSDLTKRVTLQNLYNDGGFSNVGVSQEIIDIISPSDESWQLILFKFGLIKSFCNNLL